MPMPNAVVAATTSIRPARKLSSVSERTPGASPAWYGAAEMPAPSRCADTSSHVTRLPQ